MSSKITIDIIAQDLLTLKCDACVSSIHRSRDLRMGPLAKQILKEAGEPLQEDIRSKKSGQELYQGEVVVANPQNLRTNFKYLYFICLKKWREGNDVDLQKAVDWVLKDADRKKLSTIVFPPLGTGGQGYPPIPVALAIFQAIIAYSIDNPETNITSVKIALFHQKNEMLEAFTDILEVGVNITPQVKMADPDTPPEKKESFLKTCQRTIFARAKNSNWFPSISRLFGWTPPIFYYQIGPANLSATPYVNVKQKGVGASLTIGLTISAGLLPAVLAKRLTALI